jgi:hypothetical protein
VNGSSELLRHRKRFDYSGDGSGTRGAFDDIMMTVPKESPSEEFARFDENMRKLLSVPREVYQKRLDKWKEEPGTRGPKRKVKKPSAVPAPPEPPQV